MNSDTMRILAIIILCLVGLALTNGHRRELPEENMNVQEIIRYQGYPVELHHVYTSDGYILTLHRIPHGKKHQKKNSTSFKHPVLLQHGLAASASNWITNLPNQSLGYILADNGYDVWLGNVRGNTYSKTHLTLKPTDRKFWDFSWQDMAEFDLPAMIKYILTNTTAKNLSYIGHSQGTLIAFAKFSTDVSLARKIRTFVALAPVATVGHISSPLKTLAPFSGAIRTTLSVFGDYSLGSLKWITKYIKPACDQPFGTMLCENLLFYIIGPESKANLNQTRIPVYMAHNPDDTSMKNVVHFAQMVRSQKMRRYDYGWIGNWMHYGSLSPPEYNLREMNVSTVAFWSPEDALADPSDISFLLPLIQRLLVYRVDGFSHVDFLWSELAVTQVYSKILKILELADDRRVH